MRSAKQVLALLTQELHNCTSSAQKGRTGFSRKEKNCHCEPSNHTGRFEARSDPRCECALFDKPKSIILPSEVIHLDQFDENRGPMRSTKQTLALLTPELRNRVHPSTRTRCTGDSRTSSTFAIKVTLDSVGKKKLPLRIVGTQGWYFSHSQNPSWWCQKTYFVHVH